MRIPVRAIILVIFVGAILSAGCTQSPELKPGTPVTPTATSGQPVHTLSPATSAKPAEIQSTKDLISFVDRALTYARENGREKALAEFNDPNGQFIQGGLFIFAVGYDGTALADPFEHEIVGTNILNTTDPYGIPLVQNLIDTAREGKGLVSYQYANPSTNYTPEPKVSYVVDVDGTYYIGAGLYGNTGTEFPVSALKPAAKNITPVELVSFVQEAADYAKKNGKEKAIAAFNDPNGPFFKSELYIIAYDLNTTNLAQPLSPGISGLSLKYYTDQDSVATISELSSIARKGGGFAHTTQRIPSGGKQIYAPKLQYVVPVDDSWWVAASILNPDYGQLRSGNLSGVRVRNHTQEQLFMLVNKAVQYAKDNGKEKTLAEIGKPDGTFVNGDLFVWAETFDGVILADPFSKDMVGKSFMNYTDPYGEMTTVTGIEAMRNGSGYIHAMFPDTATGTAKPVPKLIYMKPVDDTWWIGSGIYGLQVT